MKSIFLICMFCLQIAVHGQPLIITLKMERTACPGKCPEYTVEMQRGGAVIYTGGKNAITQSTHIFKLDIAEMSELLKQFEQHDLTLLQDTFPVTNPGLPHIHFSIVTQKKRKELRNAENGPAYLITLGKAIDEKVTQLFAIYPPGSKKSNLSAVDVPPEAANEKVYHEEETIFEFVQIEPEFPGGTTALVEFIYKELKYPAEAAKQGIEGRVVVNFVVEKDGSLSHVKVVRGLGGGCNEETLRIVRAMPRWMPGRQNGKVVRCAFSLPFSFDIP